MKSWFPAEHAQWHRAARIALDMQGSVPPIEVSVPNVSTAKTNSTTGGGNSGLGSGSVRALRSENRNHSYAPSTVGVAAPAALPPPNKSWLRFAVAAVFLPAILCTSGLVRALSAPIVPVDLVPQIKPASMRPKVELFPAAPPSQCNAFQNTQSPGQVSAETETGAVPETTVAVQPVSELALRSEKRAALRARASRKRPSPHRSINTSRNTSRVNNKNAHPNPF